MKNLFNLHYDTKETVWYRQNYNVAAATQEEAVQRLIDHLATEAFDSEHVTMCDGDYLIETKTLLTPEDNDGEATEIIYLQPDGNTYDKPSELWNNGDPLSKLNKHGKKLFGLITEYLNNVWDNGGQRYRRAIGGMPILTRTYLIVAHPTTLEAFYQVTGIQKNFPAEIANGIMYILQTGKPL